MEISANKLLSYGPVQQNSGSSKPTTPFKQEREKSEVTAEYQPRRETINAPDDSKLDYRQLLLQSRYQQAGTEQRNSPQYDTYRVEEEPLKTQRALGAYRENAELNDGSEELMPRLDDYA